MELSQREAWTVIHGMVLGALFLLSFAGGLAGLYSLRPELITTTGIQERLPRLRTGTWIVYPWYRASAPTSPRSLLLANPAKAEWHTFGMEWKEHVAWFAPIIATAVAFVVIYYGAQLAREHGLRRASLALFVIAFAAAGVAGIFGAFINKMAPKMPATPAAA